MTHVAKRRRLVALTMAAALWAQSPAVAQTFTDYAANAGTLGAIPDNNPAGRDVTFTVSGMPRVGAVAVSLSFSPAHTWAGDVSATLFAPDGSPHSVFARPGMTGSGFGASGDLVGPYVFRDSAAASIWSVQTTGAAVFPAGTYRTSGPLSAEPTAMDPVFAGRVGNGTWTLRVVDSAGGDTGAVSAATLSLAPLTLTNVRVDTVAGNQVRLRWNAPPIVVPTGYIVEGGVTPGIPLAAFSTGLAAPLAIFNAPNGAFWVRVRFLEGATQSPPSAEVPLFVNVAVPPSPPSNFTASVVGTTINLTWKNTFGGGVPQGAVLGVSGSATASIPLGPAESVSFSGAPGGSYSLTLRAGNGAGLSTSVGPVAITIPTACSAEPQPPTNFLFYRVGATLFLLWDPPASGGAPTSYQLNVSGAFVGTVPVAGRAVSTPVPFGSYTVSVSAVNACGTSAPTASQTVAVVP